jgi:hypothetical protein
LGKARRLLAVLQTTTLVTYPGLFPSIPEAAGFSPDRSEIGRRGCTRYTLQERLMRLEMVRCMP